ncbi:MAG: ABC transporter permease [Vibrio ordalii]|uniref:ABC transporter permease n=1 Tax=Vibrio ordalii TaxID=28174 RepID=UPI003F3C80AA
MKSIHLSLTLMKRELESKYKGSILGAVWIILNPLLLLCLYSFIFQYVFSAKWNVGETSSNYTVALFCGLVPFFFITELLGKGTELIRSNGNLVKKVVFNKIVLPISTTLSSIITLLINILLLLISSYLFNDDFSAFKLLTFVYIVPIAILGYSICTICSCIGVYFRDFSNIVSFINPVLMFSSPIFFNSETMSEDFKMVINLNPLTHIIEGIRGVMLENEFDMSGYMLMIFFGLIFLSISSFLFHKLKEDFSDLI